MAMLTVLITLLALPAALVLWNAQSLAHNRAKAKATGLPYLERWISPINPFWLLYGSSFVRLCERFGIASENLSRIYSYGWEANSRAEVHEFANSDVVLVIHPGGLQLCVADAEIIYDILQRRTDFRRNMEEMAVLNVYGKNLSTTDDQEWQRHRKMTGVTFTEKNNELVWSQSLVQAKGMLEYWTKRSQQPIRSTSDDTKIFTLNVLAAALFNKVYSFEGQAEESSNRHIDDKSYMYRASLSTILSSIIQIFILGEEGLKARWTPKSWKGAAEAMATFRSYLLGLMDEERMYMQHGQTDRQHLVARLVRACEESDDGKSLDESRKVNMTEEEIISNLFVYAFAGNDTTAIALTNLITHLSANPQTQDWLAEELQHYLPDSDPESWSYDNLKRLKRCGAVIYESLRICHPLSQLVKTTGPTPQPLVVNGKTYIIPAGTSVHCSLPALHSHPKYWGKDPLAWNPEQHINSATHDDKNDSFDAEVLAADTSEHFIPWAWGQRVCPGKRFSQAELVAVLAGLFRNWRVEVVPEEGENLDEAQKRAWKTSLKVDHQGHMLHEMVNPGTVGLRWVRRD
ncbi:cytochrome P450 monooxygenase-like protein [Ophiobolus disseminans]|uniref:Cytochrome P450 monooxygenase-like protein n=1 Tax=Ophiobolus disseminans TaxID=1469910 RepID=A0A6A6ZBH6_9PLEO|nr:cytochrome P450 monooxygenase-like protein [Ophiobolus disseminans]